MEDDFQPDPEKARADRMASISIFLGALSCAGILLWGLFVPCIIIGPILGILAIATGWMSHRMRPSRDAKGGMLLGLLGVALTVLTVLAFAMAFGW
jgi:hypothetical protein